MNFKDEHSRFLVHHELLTSIDWNSLGLTSQSAINKLPRGEDGLPLAKLQICRNNGRGYISREFREVVAGNQMMHVRIRPHCPQQNGLVERCHRTLREALQNASMEDSSKYH
jgi:putative transposase